MCALKSTNTSVLLDKVDPRECNPGLLGPMPPAVHKLPFRVDDLPFFDSSYLCDPVAHSYLGIGGSDSDQEQWDAPLRRRATVSSKITVATQMPYNQCSQTEISGVNSEFSNINEIYSRDPSVPFNPIGKRLV